MGLSLLVANKLLDEAFYFYKQNVIKDKEIQLLKHLFQGREFQDVFQMTISKQL